LKLAHAEYVPSRHDVAIEACDIADAMESERARRIAQEKTP
jgi:hypothetical protein